MDLEEAISHVERANAAFEEKKKLEEELAATVKEPSEEPVPVSPSSPSTTVVDDPLFMDILGNGQLTKRILVQAPADAPRPENAWLCKINLEARLEDGTVVEKLHEAPLQVGDYEAVQGVDMAIPLMSIGEKAEIRCAARFAYGELGLKNEAAPELSIPSNAPMTFIVELLSAEEEPELEERSVADRLAVGNRKRERGNFWFDRGEYNFAIQVYRRALQFLDDESTPATGKDATPNEQLQELLEARLRAQNNLAMAQMKAGAWDAALASVEAVLRCQPENVKALFRKGKIVAQKGKTADAIALLHRAAILDPESKAVQNELSKLIMKSKLEARNEKDLYQKMLGQAQKLEQQVKKPKIETRDANNFKLWGYLFGTILIGVAGIAIYRYNNF